VGILYGPPGTGKTTFGTRLTQEWLGVGVRPDELAYLAFTKAAAKTAVHRIYDQVGDLDLDFPYFRTIHSLSFQGLKRERPDSKVIAPSDMKKFSKESGLDGSFAVSEFEDLADVYRRLEDRGRTVWDQAKSAYDLSRITSSTPAELDRCRTAMSPFAAQSVGFLEGNAYQAFVRKYEDWKAKEGLIDFTDMLEYALRSMVPLDRCRKVIVDEAQDLCPLHHAIVDRVFRNAEEVVFVGDDDQSIFTFSGASAELFLKRAATASLKVVLRQTHRYGQQIVDFSQKIIRHVKTRQEKEVIGVSERGATISMAGRFEPMHGKILVLHRHVQGCQAAAEAYVEAGIPFRNERGHDPLGSTKRIQGWRAIDLLSRGDRAPIMIADVLIGDLMPSVMKDEDRTRLVVHGSKKRVALCSGDMVSVSLQDLLTMNVLTPAGAKMIAERRYDVFNHSKDLAYYGRLSKNGYGLDARDLATITTIHGSKGREADEVVLFSEMGRKCWKDPDTEHRLAYVGATRTRSNLTICCDDLVDWAESDYEYPMERVQA